jgi:hypothetical protein
VPIYVAGNLSAVVTGYGNTHPNIPSFYTITAFNEDTDPSSILIKLKANAAGVLTLTNTSRRIAESDVMAQTVWEPKEIRTYCGVRLRCTTEHTHSVMKTACYRKMCEELEKHVSTCNDCFQKYLLRSYPCGLIFRSASAQDFVIHMLTCERCIDCPGCKTGRSSNPDCTSVNYHGPKHTTTCTDMNCEKDHYQGRLEAFDSANARRKAVVFNFNQTNEGYDVVVTGKMVAKLVTKDTVCAGQKVEDVSNYYIPEGYDLYLFSDVNTSLFALALYRYFFSKKPVYCEICHFKYSNLVEHLEALSTTGNHTINVNGSKVGSFIHLAQRDPLFAAEYAEKVPVIKELVEANKCYNSLLAGHIQENCAVCSKRTTMHEARSINNPILAAMCEKYITGVETRCLKCACYKPKGAKNCLWCLNTN